MMNIRIHANQSNGVSIDDALWLTLAVEYTIISQVVEENRITAIIRINDNGFTALDNIKALHSQLRAQDPFCNPVIEIYYMKV